MALANNEKNSDIQDVRLSMEMIVSFLLNTREKQSKAVPWQIHQTFGALHLPLGVNMYPAYLENAEIIAPKHVGSKFLLYYVSNKIILFSNCNHPFLQACLQR